MVNYMPSGMNIIRRYGRVKFSPTSYSNGLSIDTQRAILEKRNEKSRLAKKLNSKG